MIKKFYITLILCLISITVTFGQKQNSYPVDSLRQKLSAFCDIFLKDPSPTIRLKAAQDSENLLISEIETRKADFFNLPLDSIFGITRLVSPDNKFLILNWATPQENGNHAYFGIIVYEDGNYTILKEGKIKKYLLDQEILEPDNWFGALYYKIILTTSRKQTYYTLLGWNGNSFSHNRKIVEVLSFPEPEKPQFGAKIFDEPPLSSRVIFTYNKNASMALKYEKQKYIPENKKKSVEEEVIVFDHLIPMGRNMGSSESQNVPSFVFDAYRWDKKMWIFISDIDARNHKQRPPRDNNKSKVEHNLFGN